MTSFELLKSKIKSKEAKIGVIGLGYVGLPLAFLFVKNDFQVTGFVRNKNRKDMLLRGESPLSEKYIDDEFKTQLNRKKFLVSLTTDVTLEHQDIIIVCVPTPVTKSKKPDLTDLNKVSERLNEFDLSHKLIINESTVAPFTTREVFGHLKGPYFLACSPERIDPGNKGKTTENIPKVIGGINWKSSYLARMLYQEIMLARVVEISTLEAAEMAKMLENSFRAVNIALINEFAKLAEACGIDILEVVKAAKTKWSFQPHYPGIGVGGHCIPVDPYYILDLAKQIDITMPVIKEGLRENEKMPEFVAKKVFKHYKKGMTVLVYGITYKKNVNDIRESPVISFCNALKKEGVDFFVYDPFVRKEIILELGFATGNLEKVDIFVVGTDHDSLRSDSWKSIGQDTIVIDGRNFFVKKQGKVVYGVGRSLV